jgi:hypothetical protein
LIKGILIALPGTADAYANLSGDGDPIRLMILGSAIPSVIVGFLIFSNVETLILKKVGCKTKAKNKVSQSRDQ